MRSRLFCVTVALALLATPATAAPICPAEVKEARELLTAKAAVAQRPKSQAGARGQETQAPREQAIQAPRGHAEVPASTRIGRLRSASGAPEGQCGGDAAPFPCLTAAMSRGSGR